MRLLRNLPEALMIVAIALAALVDLTLYAGFVKGEDAVAAGRAGNLPGGNAPTVDETRFAAERAESDGSADLPGRYVPSQGRGHTTQWPLARRVEYCREGEVSNACYASKPPTSGLHLPVQRGILLPSGDRVNIPPDPGEYAYDMPREVIPHIQEHAGIFVGYRCASAACDDALERLREIVTEELALGARVVLAPFSDLDPDTIGMASWTRVDTFALSELTDERVRAFIKAHSCRFDPEGFCRSTPVN